jgi:TldD protein
MLKDIEKVLALPARLIDINYQMSSSTNIVTKDGSAKDISVGETQGFGVRVLDKVWGFASSNDPKDLMDAAKRALKAAKVGDGKIKFRPVDGVLDKVKTSAKIEPAKVPLEEKIDLGARAFDSIKNRDSVVSSQFTYVDSNVSGLYANSEGAEINWESTKVAFIGGVFVKKDAVLQFGSERAGATAGFEFIKNPEGLAEKAADKAERLLDAKAAPSGRFKVVCDPLLTGVFIHEALGHAVEADHILQGESILEGRLGEAIASEKVTVYDDPTIEGSFGFYFYDSEGTKAKKTTLIEDGRLRRYIHSRETSSTLDMENTGNARSQGYDHLPIVRMSNTLLKPRDLTVDELFEGIDYGVYLLGSKGGEVDPAKGVFQFSAEEGFLIEKGELTTPIKDVALSGEILTILREIDGVGREFDSHIGFCGKEGQAVPVGDGGAHVRTVASVGGVQ